MNLFDMTIIKHPDLAADEAWIITDRNAPQVPKNIKNNLPIPCILTGNTLHAERTLTLLRAISHYEDKATSRSNRRTSVCP